MRRNFVAPRRATSMKSNHVENHLFFFFLNDPPPTEFYPLPHHDPLPIQKGQHPVVPHQQGHFCPPLHAELPLRGLEGPPAAPVGPEELLAVSYHRLFYGLQRR